jgi:hypothetical protein
LAPTSNSPFCAALPGNFEGDLELARRQIDLRSIRQSGASRQLDGLRVDGDDGLFIRYRFSARERTRDGENV